MPDDGIAEPKLILCDCLGSQKIDGAALEEATGLACSRLHSDLCGGQADDAARALAEGNAVICCGQESHFFEDLAREIEAEPPVCIDIRDRAGWTDDEKDVTAKQAALVAGALSEMAPAKSLDVVSEGLCLIFGPGEVALRAAERLKDTLGVTVLISDETETPDTRAYDVIRGRLRSARGSLGRFDVRFDALQQPIAGGRGAFGHTDPRDGGGSSCDILLDLTGNPPLFPAPEKRDGYLRAEPNNALAVADAIFEASQMIGTFEKPLYVRLEEQLCAHSRAEQTGCSNCLDNCPTGAITSDGDHVKIDPLICAGCGSCSSLCPSGAITFDAPPTADLIRRIQVLAQTYKSAGGESPRLLCVDGHGAEMVRLLARHGKGLPANVIPLEVASLNTVGHAEILAALASGFEHVTLVPGPRTEAETLAREVQLAAAITGEPTVAIADTSDPDQLGERLYETAPAIAIASPVRPVGTRRQITRQAAKALHPETETLALPETAPYGAVLVDTDACTLCLSCVSLCPTGALGDNPDLPQLRFQEDACLQCGICANVCPEDAIAYEPRLNLADNALEQVVLNEEEPFACIKCGTLFGSKSTVERITEKLSGHSMYQSEGALAMIQMCDDCRVNAQFHSENNPFEAGERPKPRTTDDYLSKRRDH